MKKEATRPDNPNFLQQQARFDDIHLNKIGCYYIGCVMYATLLGKSPAGATGTVKNIWGQPLVDLSPAQAKVLQDLAWEAVTG
ncbi:hypothetical protein MCEMSE15_00377 [Fimbriimonadaceae bacterium]